MPLRPCLEPGCPRYAARRGRCKDCAAKREQQIDRKGRNIYGTKRWRILRRHKLSQDPLCEQCGHLADTVHHRVDIGQGGEQYAIENLTSLCAACHNKETRMRQVVRTK